MKDIKSKIEKRRKIVISIAIGILGLSVLGSMILGLISLLGKQKTTQAKSMQIAKESEIVTNWKDVIETRISELENRLERIEKHLQSISNKLEAEKQEKERKTTMKEKPSVKEKELPQKLPPIEIKLKPSKILEPPSEVIQKEKEKKKPPKIIEYSVTKKKEKKEEKKKEEKPSIYLPLGFTKALLLNGLDAPTLQYGRENPHPVLLLILDKAIIANNRKLNLKGCFAFGSGYGELSSERAYIKISRISCIDKEGNIYQRNVEGVVVDADGKTGLKGRLVSKFGSVLAKQFMAGILEGISRILQASYTTVQISPIGTTSTIKPEDVTKVSIASGFGSASRKLADFYISLAKEYFPVIEINAGRRVSILFYGGEKLEKTATYSPGINGRL